MGNSCKSKPRNKFAALPEFTDDIANSAEKRKVKASNKPSDLVDPADKDVGDRFSERVTDSSSEQPLKSDSEHSKISSPSKPLGQPTALETQSVTAQGATSKNASSFTNSNTTLSSSRSGSIPSVTPPTVPFIKSVRSNPAQNSKSLPILQVASLKPNSVKQPNPSNSYLNDESSKRSQPKESFKAAAKNARSSPKGDFANAVHDFLTQNKNKYGKPIPVKPAYTFSPQNKKPVSNASQKHKLPTAEKSTTFTRLQDRQDGSKIPKIKVQPKAQSAPEPSSKKKLVVKGLKQFVTSRGSCPPAWVRDFPCKSKFHPDNYIYDWTEPKKPCRPTAAMLNCPKQSARCGTCGIYTPDVCNCCKKCPTDCGCPKLQNRFPDALSQAFGPGLTQAQQAISEMTNQDRAAPIGGNTGKLLRNSYVSVNEQAPPHLRCHIDVLNPCKPETSCGSNNGSFDSGQFNYQAPITHGYNSPSAMPSPFPYYCYPPAPPMFPAYYPPPMQPFIPQQPSPYGYGFPPNCYPTTSPLNNLN